MLSLVHYYLALESITMKKQRDKNWSKLITLTKLRSATAGESNLNIKSARLSPVLRKRKIQPPPPRARKLLSINDNSSTARES